MGIAAVTMLLWYRTLIWFWAGSVSGFEMMGKQNDGGHPRQIRIAYCIEDRADSKIINSLVSIQSFSNNMTVKSWLCHINRSSTTATPLKGYFTSRTHEILTASVK